jgi:hypothetical protein
MSIGSSVRLPVSTTGSRARASMRASRAVCSTLLSTMPSARRRETPHELLLAVERVTAVADQRLEAAAAQHLGQARDRGGVDRRGDRRGRRATSACSGS